VPHRYGFEKIPQRDEEQWRPVIAVLP
jgi:hypothetical protein